MSEKLSRSEIREGAFLELFQIRFGTNLDEIDELNSSAFDLAKNKYTDELVRGVLEHNEELTEIIAGYSKTRSVSRIAAVNLVILKIAVYEMKYCDKVPNVVAINEAIELAKKYSLKSDSGFVNAVLNSYKNDLEKNVDKLSAADND